MMTLECPQWRFAVETVADVCRRQARLGASLTLQPVFDGVCDVFRELCAVLGIVQLLLEDCTDDIACCRNGKSARAQEVRDIEI